MTTDQNNYMQFSKTVTISSHTSTVYCTYICKAKLPREACNTFYHLHVISVNLGEIFAPADASLVPLKADWNWSSAGRARSATDSPSGSVVLAGWQLRPGGSNQSWRAGHHQRANHGDGRRGTDGGAGGKRWCNVLCWGVG